LEQTIFIFLHENKTSQVSKLNKNKASWNIFTSASHNDPNNNLGVGNVFRLTSVHPKYNQRVFKPNKITGKPVPASLDEA
jgi:hypothetical protein